MKQITIALVVLFLLFSGKTNLSQENSSAIFPATNDPMPTEQIGSTASQPLLITPDQIPTQEKSAGSEQQFEPRSIPFLYGDVTCDGVVDILDVVATINYILGLNPDPYCMDRADLNADATVDILDAVFTINMILETPGQPCPGAPTMTDIDGNIYNTVQIGNQCWMKENLKTTHYRSGTPITYPENSNVAWQNNTDGAYAWYDNDIGWKDSYGGIYNWYAVSNVNQLCPSGWHIPTDDDWTQLTNFITGGLQNGANQLKSCRQLNSPLGGNCDTEVHPRWYQNQTHFGTDFYGFSALPAGARLKEGNYTSLEFTAFIWASTITSPTTARMYFMRNDNNTIVKSGDFRNTGISVRCLKTPQSLLNIPTVTTSTVSEITTDQAVSGGNITDDGGIGVSARGLVWSTTEDPTIVDNIGFTNDGTGPGAYTSTMAGLLPATTYYVRAYASNSLGTAYGEERSFETASAGADGSPCPGIPTVTDIDGNVYNTVLIGDQCWMKENLKTTSYRNGTNIDYPGTDNTAWQNNTTGAYTWYENDISWKNPYGALYNWYAVDNPSGLCPSGWRAPANADWFQLLDYLNNDLGIPNNNTVNGAANALKSCRQVASPLGGDCATNEHPRFDQHNTHFGNDLAGFSALPAGYRGSIGIFANLGSYANFWSTTANPPHNQASVWNISRYYGEVEYYNSMNNSGNSVRCILEGK